MLDSGAIDFAVLDILETLKEQGDKFTSINTDNARLEFIKLPIIRALLDFNILYKSKYYDIMHVEHHLYKAVLRKFVKERKS